MPHAALKRLADEAKKSFDQFKSILDFSLEKNPQNPAQARDSLIDAVRDHYDSLYTTMAPYLAYLIRLGTDFEALEAQARESVSELIANKDSQLKVMESLKRESEDILTAMRRASADAGVSEHETHFDTEAKNQSDSARRWMIATICVASAGALLSLGTIALYAAGAFSVSKEYIVQISIAKIVFFSLLYFVLVWCSRNYRAHQHNAIVNRHRKNALKTFQAFVKAAGSDNETKNAVLLRATEAIFVPGSSGYFEGESEGHSSMQVLEILRSGMGKNQ